MMRAIVGIGLVVLTSFGLSGQMVAPSAFDVASVKPNKSGSGSSSQRDRGGRLTATNVSLQYCIKLAYGVRDYQISGPAWLNSERYDIAAKTEAPVSPARYKAMIQTLLADRFKLKVHREVKELPVYVLVVGKRGSKLHEVEAGEAEQDSSGRGYILGHRMSMAHLADKLAQIMDRPVFDMTEIKGVFDVELKWTPDDERRPEANSADGPSSIFTAVQEQLGLKLEARKRPVEIIVVDHAEKVPTEN